METFILSNSLKEQGFKLWPSQKKALNEVIVFDGDHLYASNDTNPYHIYFLKNAKKGKITKSLLEGYRNIKGVNPEEILQTKYEPDLDIIFASSWHAVTDVLDPEIRFYRLIHEDARPRVEINSLWLAIPEVASKLEPFLLPPAGKTSFSKTDAGVFETKALEKGSRLALIGDNALKLYLQLDGENQKWKVDK